MRFLGSDECETRKQRQPVRMQEIDTLGMIRPGWIGQRGACHESDVEKT